MTDRDDGAGAAAAAPPHPDPWRHLDAQTDVAALIESLEARGAVPTQARLRRRFLRFIPLRRGEDVVDIGCGTGVVTRDIAAMVGPRGRVVGVDASRTVLATARRLAAGLGLARRVTFRAGPGTAIPCAADRFAASVAVTLLLHVADPLAVVQEMARVTRPGGRVALQDQDFGTVAVEHPDDALTERVLLGVARRIYEEPHSGRRLPALLRAAGLTDVRLLTEVYQDTALEPYTRTFLERRAENAVRFGLVDAAEAQRWLDGFTALAAAGAFVFTMNYYGAVGVKPAAPRRRPR